jgi:hypothetical protein
MSKFADSSRCAQGAGSGVGVNAPQRQVCAAKALEPDAGADNAEKGRWQESCEIVA